MAPCMMIQSTNTTRRNICAISPTGTSTQRDENNAARTSVAIHACPQLWIYSRLQQNPANAMDICTVAWCLSHAYIYHTMFTVSGGFTMVYQHSTMRLTIANVAGSSRAAAFAVTLPRTSIAFRRVAPGNRLDTSQVARTV